MITATINQFLNDLPRSPRTVSTYREGLKLYAAVIGEADHGEETYKKFLMETRHLSPGTQHTYAGAVRSFLVRVFKANPAVLKQYTQDWASPRGKRLLRFDLEAIEKVETYAQGLAGDLNDLRDRALILTLIDTGLRIHEACGLKRGEIQWESAQAIIIGKGDKEAVIRFSDRALAAIQDYLRKRAEMDGKMGTPLASLPLFARHDKGAGARVKPLLPGGAWAAFKQRLVEAGVERLGVRVHDLRHMFCTRTYHRSGRDLILTKELARHERESTTARYTHIGESELTDRYNKIFNRVENGV